MTEAAFTGLTVTISRYNDLSSDVCWLARLEFYPHVQGIGKEPEDALRTLRESWLSATTIAKQNDSYHLRQINNDNEDYLQSQHETLEGAFAASKPLTLGVCDSWYITHQNKLIAQSIKRAENV